MLGEGHGETLRETPLAGGTCTRQVYHDHSTHVCSDLMSTSSGRADKFILTCNLIAGARRPAGSEVSGCQVENDVLPLKRQFRDRPGTPSP